MSNKLHKILYKAGIYTIGYDNKFLTPLHRIAEPFTMILDGLLGIILLVTPCVPNLNAKLLHSIIDKKKKDN